MDFSEIKTDVEVLKKQIYGNGVKGAITRIEDLEEKLDSLELHMNKTLSDTMQAVLDKIESKRKFSLSNFFIITALCFDVIFGIVNR